MLTRLSMSDLQVLTCKQAPIQHPRYVVRVGFNKLILRNRYSAFTLKIHSHCGHSGTFHRVKLKPRSILRGHTMSAPVLGLLFDGSTNQPQSALYWNRRLRFVRIGFVQTPLSSCGWCRKAIILLPHELGH